MLSTWKGLMSEWRALNALAVFHSEFPFPLIKSEFWIAARRSGTSSGHEFPFTNSAATMARNWSNWETKTSNKKLKQEKENKRDYLLNSQIKLIRRTASIKTLRTAGSALSKAVIKESLKCFPSIEFSASSLSIFRLVKFLRYVAAATFRPCSSPPIFIF